MSYSIVTTPGLILSSSPYLETGKILTIFTKDLGIVNVIAQGLRSVSSKLRYHTQDYTFAEYSLVRGKEFWRLTNVQTVYNIRASGQITMLLAKVTIIIKRFLVVEEPYQAVFDTVDELVQLLSRNEPVNMAALESLAVAKILLELGYIGDVKNVSGILRNKKFEKGDINIASQNMSLLNREINKAIHSAQM